MFCMHKTAGDRWYLLIKLMVAWNCFSHIFDLVKEFVRSVSIALQFPVFFLSLSLPLNIAIVLARAWHRTGTI